MTCNKEKDHFDAGSFAAGLGITAVAFTLIVSFFLTTDRSIHREAELPKTCESGQQILMTTAPTVELYVCETKWIRK
jgi:hypothetical protein